jgi:hypothetical protein
VHPEPTRAHLSRIFDWYRDDFLKASPSIPAYLEYSWRLSDSKPESDGAAAPPRAP